MGMITAQRIAAALLGGSMSGAQLETLLGTSSGIAGWKLCAATESIKSIMLADQTAKSAWMGSNKAVDAMAALSVEIAEMFAADSTVIASVFSTASRADAWFANSVTRAAIWGSDTALTALAASATGKARARACAKYTLQSVVGVSAEQTFPEPLGKDGERWILVGWGASANINITISGRREGSSVGLLSSYVNVSATAAIDNVTALRGPVRGNISGGYTGYFGAVRV